MPGLHADQITTGVGVGDLFRLVDVDPPNAIAGFPAGIDARLVSGGSGIKRIGWAFDASGNAPGLESSYTRHSVVLWSGTTFYGRPPVRFKALVEAEDADKTFSIRVYDVTNSKVIAELAGITSVLNWATLTLAPLADVTNDEAVWEVQLKRPAGGGPNAINVLLGFVQVEFE